MRCKKHLSDLSSSVGVCASCLREKLQSIIAAQSLRSHSQSHNHHHHLHDHHHQENHHPVVIKDNNSCLKFDQNPQQQQQPSPPPPLIFPRSVSPYISRRKSDSVGVDNWSSNNHPRHQVSVSHHSRFFSTPQAGPTISGAATTSSTTTGTSGSSKKKQGKFQAISKLFRSRSHKLGQSDVDSSSSSDPRIFTRQPSEEASSSSWISNFGFGRRKKTMRFLSLNEAATTTFAGGGRARDRGMSPDLTDDEGWPPCSPGFSQGEEWKRTPRSAHATSTKRTSHWGFRPSPGRSNLAFCLSPMVRASPTRHWYGKGGGAAAAAGLGTPDVGYSGEIRGGSGGGSVKKPHISAASTFCANRSRKLADFGRSNPKR